MKPFPAKTHVCAVFLLNGLHRLVFMNSVYDFEVAGKPCYSTHTTMWVLVGRTDTLQGMDWPCVK